MNLKIALVANCPISHKSMGGGDRTLIELAKAWQKLGAELTVFGPPESKSVCQVGGLNVKFIETSKYEAGSLGTTKAYFLRIVGAIFNHQEFEIFDIIYSASEALPDVVLSLQIKRQNPKSHWVVGFFLRARNPVFGEVQFSFSSLLQLVQQQASLLLMSLFKVTGVLVAGKPDEKYIQNRGFKNVLKIGGGVDLGFVNSIPDQEKIYDACFVGRLSQQKGIDDILPVWQSVTRAKPDAKLAIIGWGHKGEAEKFRSEIESFGLSKSINFIGFSDGVEKYKVVKSSKISLFPSKYESFGIVLLESLAAGVPVVAYELPVLKDNFTQGVVYVPLGDRKQMVQEILKLLGDENKVSRKSAEGLQVASLFGWRRLGEETFNYLINLHE